MKRFLLSFCIVLVSSVFSQEVERVQLKRDSETMAVFPHIAGVFQGEIPFAYLTDSVGVATSVGWKVIGYEIHYNHGRVQKQIRVTGSSIPEQCIREIRQGSLGEIIFFTEIKAIDPKGKIVYLTPMHLTPILNE